MADVIDKALAVKTLRDLAESLEKSGSNVYITALIHDSFRATNTERLTIEWKR